jgi:hypothetical protein
MSSSPLYTPFIEYNHQHRVAICSPCGTGHTKKNLKRHLCGRPHSLKKYQWRPILDALKDKPLLESHAHFPRPSNGSRPVPHLKIGDGYQCDICGFVVTSQQVMKGRHAKYHRNTLKWGQCFYRPVKVQVSFVAFFFD